MNPQFQAPTGSTIWQLVFLSFAAVLVLFEVLRGWRRGVARQLARLGGLISAYFVAFFGGSLLTPMLRPFVKMPDFALSALAGAVLAIVVYAAFEGFGTVLFRRTNQHDSWVVRLLFGTGGAVLGLIFGAFFVWLFVVGIRSIGAVADASIRAKPSEGVSMTQTIHPIDERRRLFGQSTEEHSALAPSLADLKNSIETGVVGEAVKRTDIVPSRVYDNLGKIGAIVSSPESAEKFLSFPGARELADDPKIVALRDDPDIADLIGQGRFFDLLQNQKIIDAANDPDLRARLKTFDVSAALDFALKK